MQEAALRMPVNHNDATRSVILAFLLFLSMFSAILAKLQLIFYDQGNL